MLIFTVVPVIAGFPYVDSMTAGNAVFRLIDPIFTLPLNLFVLLYADVLHNPGVGHYHQHTAVWILWSIGAAIYVQGHGVHLAAALFKVLKPLFALSLSLSAAHVHDSDMVLFFSPK
ncbi:hypothetical protein BX666DRAFT_1474669 [Dichotomocladium elegans]|nr:hypothetical protein BX666DRAFT_1474669 [Dichotomocladium elegans]